MLKPVTFDFLIQLKENNHREWMNDNKSMYASAKSDYEKLAGELLEGARDFDAGLTGLTYKDCIFRINRDIRFSSDKSPYKTNFGIVLNPGGKKTLSAAYYIHIEPGASFVGGGLWIPPSDILLKVRKEISYFYDELKSILAHPQFLRHYNGIDQDMTQRLTRAPKGFSEDDPAIDILKLKSVVCTSKLTDRQVLSEDFVHLTLEYFKTLKPLLDFLNRGIMSDEFGGIH